MPTLAGLDTLLAAMLSIDINKRPTTILAVKQELQRLVTHYQQGQIQTIRSTLSAIYQAPATLPKSPVKVVKSVAALQIPPMSNMLYTCYGHGSRVTALAWSPNGKWLASASYDKTVRVWDATNGAYLLTYKEHHERVNALAWSPDSTKLVSASHDGTVRVWNALSGTPIVTYSGHAGPVNAVAWSPVFSANGTVLPSHIASGGTDKTVHIWDSSQGINQSIFRSHTDAVYAVAWSPDGKRVASAGEDRCVLVWYPVKEQSKKSFFTTLTSLLSTQRDILKMQSHDGRVNGLAWSPDSKYIASASSDHWVLIRDAFAGTTAYSYGIGRKGMKNCVAWAPNGKHIASGGNDKTVELWSTTTKSSSFVYHGHVGYVTAIAWSPDSTRIASAGVDRIIQVWQAV
jgi:WD40 repeat protein